MATYRTKEIVEADIYEKDKGMEDGFTCYPLTMICNWHDEEGNYKQCKSCILKTEKVPYIDTLTGMQYLNEGDYIVTSNIGYRWVATKEEFEQKYEEISEDNNG